MTYKQAYKILNDYKKIDAILTEEYHKGTPWEMCKYELIRAIESYIDFIKTPMFERCEYWCDVSFWNTDDEKRRARMFNAVAVALASHQMQENEKQQKALEYLVTVRTRAAEKLATIEKQ